MATIHKIMCDICKNEIEIKKDLTLAMFEKVELLKKLDLFPHKRLDNEVNPEDNLVKTHYDLCNKCAMVVEEYIKKIQQENDKNTNIEK